MSETLAILDEQGFHLRVHDAWHHGLSREQSHRLLQAAGFDWYESERVLESAVWWPEPAEIEYRLNGRRRWLVNGRAVTREGAMWEFRQVGMTYDAIRHLMRIYRLCAEIEARLPPPLPDTLTVEEARRLIADGLNHALSLRVARRWANEHLRPARSRHPLGLCGWKERFECDNPKRCLTEEDFAKALKEAGIEVDGNDVYATEIDS